MKDKATTPKPTSSRILALDYLRGFFIVIIISDHLWRWPNLFELLSGRGELWSSAAEGFVIISGLLVGYIRGYKNRSQPLFTVSKKLVARGIMLYAWMIITTLLLVSASWLLDFEGSMAYVPIPEDHWSELIISVIRLDYVHTLTHFLYLYAIFLAISPLVIWLLRKGKYWIVALASIIVWALGVQSNTEWMQWQILFFLPAVGGFYLEPLLDRYRALSKRTRLILRVGLIGLTIVTVILSELQVLPQVPGTFQSILFGRDPITLATVGISFLWFLGLLSLFQYLLPWLKKWLGWLLLAFGERSLTAYILHTIPLVLCALLFKYTTNIFDNTLLSVLCILFTWGLLKIPHINKVIPR
jgi:hypothetical protein